MPRLHTLVDWLIRSRTDAEERVLPTAQAVIIGGGCVGTSTLFHLTRLGVTDVVLLEADVLGAGSTSKAAGGIRMQHEDAVNTEIALRSLAEFERFEELTGVDIGFKQVGYLFVLDDAAPRRELHRGGRYPARTTASPPRCSTSTRCGSWSRS